MNKHLGSPFDGQTTIFEYPETGDTLPTVHKIVITNFELLEQILVSLDAKINTLKEVVESQKKPEAL